MTSAAREAAEIARRSAERAGRLTDELRANEALLTSYGRAPTGVAWSREWQDTATDALLETRHDAPPVSRASRRRAQVLAMLNAARASRTPHEQQKQALMTEQVVKEQKIIETTRVVVREEPCAETKDRVELIVVARHAREWLDNEELAAAAESGFADMRVIVPRHSRQRLFTHPKI